MILHLIETGGPGGAEQMLLRLAGEYARRGHQQIVCLRKVGWLSAEVQKRSFRLHVEPMMHSLDAAWLARMHVFAKTIGVTAIHAHEFSMNLHGALLARLLRVPTVTTVHGKNYYADRLVRRAACRAISRLAHMVAVSEDVRSFLAERVGVSPGRIQVIPNGVDTALFTFDPQRRGAVRAALEVPDDAVLIGAVGSYYPVKGHRHLVEAFGRLVPDFPTVRLVLAGQGPLQGELEALIQGSGLEARARVIGYQEDVAGFLSALDIFVQPSLSEGLPLAVLEAASTARAIVASSVGGIPEVFKDGVDALLVPPAEPDALRAALAVLALSDARRSSLGRQARCRAESEWSIGQVAERYLDLLYPRRAGAS